MNQIVNMIMRRVMGQLINRGVNLGFDQASKIGKGKKSTGEQSDVSPEEDARRNRAARAQGKQSRQMLKAMRRLGRF
ncbi:hypothetical protein SAMN04488040_1038 [Sulfitobacter marinus]|jgi:hypothetical protein|uniref:Uncharacterized protein n=1 Tax=Sulfitobacter marinus TaxID=394264 RepID=A0A1I6QY36_9RHOB|nr:hypothetical protein [Sulfitobacter marinus]SFS57158.1 hypothetical protein SAMN04488040_1038 [Sulfitobacter marinus]